MKRVFFAVVILALTAIFSACSVPSVPDVVMSTAIKKDVNLRLIASGQGNYIFQDTQVNEFKVVDSKEQKTTRGTYQVVDYTAKVTLIDSKTLKPVDKDVKGTIEFIKKEGNWWSESVKLPVK
ncbi:MAG: hypothetical protein WCR55_04855 [Lentisphaerota bacterium]